MELTKRKLKILQAIINDYITNAEPVGSRTLSKREDISFSAATIRNEMADLEEMGYLTHPHTSAGRVPSDKAYRLYVNELMNKPKLSAADKRNIKKHLKVNVNELDETIKHAARLLSTITNLTSFVISPTNDEEMIRLVQFIPMDEETVLMMIVTKSGRVSNTAIKMNMDYTAEQLQILGKSFTYNFQGKRLSEVLKHHIIEAFESDMIAMNSLADMVMPNFMKTLEKMLDVELYLDGLTNIFDLPEYTNLDRAKSFFKLLERRDDFRRQILEREDGVIVTIGDENMDDSLNECSLITASYHVDGRLVGKLGVIGPTRMKYGEITSIIEYLTDNLSNSFTIGDGNEDDNR